jgi:hypothetical protein
LRDVLFAGRQRQPLALTALSGMGGIGKMVLAHAVMRDSLVQDAFPDGVVWITIGKENTVDLLASFREVGKALGDDLQGYETLPAAINRYKTVLAQRAVLMVVDDIWKKSDLSRSWRTPSAPGCCSPPATPPSPGSSTPGNTRRICSASNNRAS